MIKKTGFISVLLLMIISTNLWAETGQITDHVTRILIADGGLWRGCMARLDKVIVSQSNVAMNCPDSKKKRQLA